MFMNKFLDLLVLQGTPLQERKSELEMGEFFYSCYTVLIPV
jgi:hypothetical protein